MTTVSINYETYDIYDGYMPIAEERTLTNDFGPHPLWDIAPKTSSTQVIIFNDSQVALRTERTLNNFHNFSEMIEEAPWSEIFLDEALHLDSAKTLLPYYKKINHLLIKRKFTICNTLLGAIKVDDMSDVLLVGIVRLTNMWKSELPAWEIVLKNTNKELSRRGHVSETLLKGLL